MAGEGIDKSKKICFVVMGFGKKTDFETGRVLDLDKSYRNMIKPAVEGAGLHCIRADEIVHSGVIDVPMYKQLLNADVVVADLSTSNKNAFYELGVRHALRPYTTVVICEDGIKAFPFDVNHVTIRKYHHLGEDIGFEEVMRFRDELTKAIISITETDPRAKDSPVYTFLNDLIPPSFEGSNIEALNNAIETRAVSGKETPVKVAGNTDKYPSADDGSTAHAETHSVLMQQVDEAQKKGDWISAKIKLSVIREAMKHESVKNENAATDDSDGQPEDPYILQRLALITYKSKHPTEWDALMEAKELLKALQPVTSNDPETLGLWGAVHKKLWELSKNKAYLDDAVRAYERGFYIRNDYYNGINYAFLLNVRANEATDRAEAIADFVEARRVRKEVRSICEQWLVDNAIPQQDKLPSDELAVSLSSWYWVKATLGEAYMGMGDDGNAQKELREAYEKAPQPWMKQSTEEQLAKLKPLLENSPLKYINNEV